MPEETIPSSSEEITDVGGQEETEVRQADVFPINDAIRLEDNAESQAKFRAVMAKAEKQKKDANENYAGIDADSGYKNACWGFSIADSRYALWHEPEFPYIEPSLGRDIIMIPEDGGLDVEVDGEAASIELVYVSNSLSKIVYVMKDCSRQDFLHFRDSLNQRYGHADEDKGVNSAAFTNIFSGKAKQPIIADADEIAKARAAVKEAEKAFNKADADLKKATGDERSELQEKRNQASSALAEANEKNASYENAISSDNIPYAYSRIKLEKDNEGKNVLPYTFTWKGQNVSGTLIFYYDKAKDTVSSLVFAKEYKK